MSISQSPSFTTSSSKRYTKQVVWLWQGRAKLRLIVWAVRLLYAVMCLFPQRRRIVLLSRQAARPFDYALLEPELARRFPNHRIVWCCVAEIGKMSIPLMLRQLWHVATADLCLVDGYVPAVSLPRSHRALVVQMWHAPGAIKRFGYQSVGTPAGRSPQAASTLRMHRGYDFVIAGMPGAVASFSEAFDMPAEKILPLGLERKKEIGILRAIGASKGNVANVFNAETFIEGLISGVFAIAVVVGVSVPVNAWVLADFGVENIMSLPWASAVVLICISVVLTLVAGLIPSSAASRRDPVEALRSE